MTDVARDEGYFESRIVPFNESAKGVAELDAAAELLRRHGADGAVLDLGCGPGLNALRLGRRHGLRVVGTDRSGVALSLARRAGLTPTVRADAARLPFRAASFGGVLIAHVLGHVAEPAGVLGEAARVLAPGGAVVAVTPNRRFVELFRLFNDRGLLPYRPDPTVRRYYDASDLRDLLAGAGLRAVRVETFGERPRFAPEMLAHGLLGESVALDDPALRERLVAVARRG